MFGGQEDPEMISEGYAETGGQEAEENGVSLGRDGTRTGSR